MIDPDHRERMEASAKCKDHAVNVNIRLAADGTVTATLCPSGTYSRSAPAPKWTARLMAVANAAAKAAGCAFVARDSAGIGNVGARSYRPDTPVSEWEPLT